jgi:hypothetical protein
MRLRQRWPQSVAILAQAREARFVFVAPLPRWHVLLLTISRRMPITEVLLNVTSS